MPLVYLSIHPSVHVLTLVNVLQMSWNLYMLFISHIKWTVNKMVYMGLKVRLQRHTKVLRYIKAYAQKNLKRISTYCTKCNKINMCHLDIQKHVSHKKWFKYYIFFVYRFTQKFFNTVYGRKFFKLFFSKLILH